VFAESGYAGTKSSGIASRAHVSRTTFYEHFENVDACLLAAYEMAAECLIDVVRSACQSGRGFDPVSRAVEDALDFLAAEPALASLLGAEAHAGIRSIGSARDRLLGRLAALLAAAHVPRAGPRPGEEAATDPARLLIEGAFASIEGTQPERVRGLAPELAELLATLLRAEQDENARRTT
jgi:AcrR family transcriptional regulator